MQFQLRTHNNNRTAGIIDALAKQVLTEPALFALEHVGQGFQWPFVGASNDTTATAIIKQRINGFLQHPLFIANNDVRRAQLHQPLQAIVTVDNTAVKIVEIGRGKATTIERYQRAQLRRNNRHNGENHPFRAVG